MMSASKTQFYFILALVAVTGLAWGAHSVHATLIPLDLTNNGAGADLDGGGSHIVNGVTITSSAVNGDPHALTNSLGVDGPASSSTDDSDQIDGPFGPLGLLFSESLTLTLTFGGATSVSFVSVNMTGVGAAGAGDAALVAISSFNGGASTLLETGVTDFVGGGDIWTPSGGIPLTSGDTIVFTAQTKYGLENLTLDIIPEPSSAVLITLCGIVLLGIRHRLMS